MGIGALPVLFSKKKKHFLTIAFSSSQGSEAAVFELAKDTGRSLLPTLEARTGKRVALQQSNEGEAFTTGAARAAAGPDTRPVSAPPETRQVSPDLSLQIPQAVSTQTPTAAPGAVGGLVEVTFASNPPGALVSFSGVNFGHTPLVTKLEARRFAVKMTAKGYLDWVREIEIQPGKPTTVVADLQPAK